MLAGAGVDAKTFKAHSVRGASSSAAMRKEVHISDILQTADWSKDSTLKRFYYRPVADDSYAVKVLSSRFFSVIVLNSTPWCNGYCYTIVLY